MSLYRVTCAGMNKSVWVVAVQRQGAGEAGRLCLGGLYYLEHFFLRVSAWQKEQEYTADEPKIRE